MHIEQVLTNEDIEDGLETTDDLLGSGILDSIGMMKLITFIEESFDIKVDPEDMVIENFMTVENVVDFIKTKK
ncbi:acyl carrier protein [Hyunsoonleella sp. 2307UL5-6]|uniref:acyl carrier protein n=1 Tax=Hyunsoonleella sp. 2307UL5-6 TaxID=3384768 RepID=UPI0039BC5976